MTTLILASAAAVAVVAWVGIDAARRRQNWFAWSFAAAFVGIFGLVAWLLRRRRLAAPEPIGVRRGLGIALTAPILLALALVVVIFSNTFLFQVARVEGGAMEPTLNNGDRVVVSKLAYRLGEPRVGDIVMLYYPLNPDKTFVKRVIAEEGDQIRIVDGRVYRNDVPVRDEYVRPEYRSHDDWGPQVVPEGYYFVMGDRRNGSSDSRHWGYVPKKYIPGRVQYRWWPLARATRF